MNSCGSATLTGTTIIDVTAGTRLFAEGDRGDAAYVVERGQIEIWVERAGVKTTLATSGPGDLVGEMAIVDGSPRSASATAVDDCRLFEITKDQFDRRMQRADPALRMTIGVLLRRARSLLASDRAARGSDVSADGYQTAIGELRLESEVADAIRDRQLEIHYQPIVDLVTGRLAGLEALVRWRHPERGLILPDQFIPLVESTGLVVDLTRYVIDEVCRSMFEIAFSALTNPINVDGLFASVNISARDLAWTNFAADVEAALGRARVEPSFLKLEVTETALMSNADAAISVLRQLRDLGIGVSVDDFGTGYSSLSYLARLPLSTLKVDRAFVSAAAIDPTSARVAMTIVRLAEILEVPTVAEGIESKADRDRFAGFGCRYGQGWLFGKPMPLEQIRDVIGTWDAAAARAEPFMPSVAWDVDVA